MGRAAGSDRFSGRRMLRLELLEHRLLLAVGANIPAKPLASLPASAQSAISSAIGQDQSAYHAASGAAGVSLANPANDFTAQLQSGTLQVSTGLDKWDMALAGLSYGGAVQPVGTAQTSVNGDRVDSNYGSIDEWFVNGPGGLEQGFTVAPLPQSEASGSLTLELTLGGDLRGTVNAAGDGLTLTRPDGAAVLGYTGLTACDATGKMLPASLEVQTEGGRQELLIHVNTAGAQGQITIDPFVQTAKLTASDGAANDSFGYSVSMSGNTLVVGAPNATVGGNNYQGAAYVFTESGSAWTQVAKLTASDGAASDCFGYSVSISGNTLVVGAWFATVGGNSEQGAAYVFTESGSAWTQVAKLTASDGAADDSFGSSVSISGNTLVVGAQGAPGNGEQGAAYVFTEPGSGWAGNLTQTAKLTASDGTADDSFGSSVSISGNTLVVGADGATVDGNAQGAAYVFTESGSAWTQVAKLTASDSAASFFGWSVSISGNTVVIGAPYATVGGNSEQGTAYVFTEPVSDWADMTQTAELTASDGAADDLFGSSVSISGNTVVIGALYATVGGNTNQGETYVFTEPTSGWVGNMTQTAKLTAPDGAADESFGSSVSISGNTVVVGAVNATVGGNSEQGAAYVFGTLAPVVTGIAPSSGPAAGGTTVTITGTGFTGATAVDFGTVAATSFVVDSDTQITATSPGESAGAVDVAVTTAGGTSATSSADQFTYLALLPTLTSLQVSAATVAFGQSVTLTATVTAALATTGTPSGGTVTFFNGSTALGTATLNNSGAATLQVATLPVGTDLLTASYSGSGIFAGSSTEIGPNSVITTVAGNGTTYSGDNGPATAAELDYPLGVAVDSAGDIFIADFYNNVVREVNHATGLITTVAGNGTAGYSGDGGPATAAEIDSPEGVGVDSADDLFIADSGKNVVREVNLSTGIITTVAGNGTEGYSGDNGPATAAELDGPNSVAVDSADDLFIADSGNNVVRKISLSTGAITTVAGNGTEGYSGDNGPATAAELDNPTGVAVDSADDLFIADSGKNVVREVNHATGLITTVAGNGTEGYSGDNGPATAAQLSKPEGVTVDSADDLFIVDNSDRIREVKLSTGIITTVAGNWMCGYSGDGGPATAAELFYSAGVAVDSAGDLFIADSGNDRIREMNYGTGVITTVAGGGVGGDGGHATAAELPYAASVVVDSVGDLFVVDTSNDRIREVNHATGVITTVAGGGDQGLGDNGPATAAQLNNPESVAVDSAGDLFIADSGNERVREVNLSTGIITTVAGNGVEGYSGDGGQATAAELVWPQDLAVDSAGDLFIADPDNECVREVNYGTGVITTVAGNGTQGYSGDNGPATDAELGHPEGVAVDSAGDLFIADNWNDRIRKVNYGTGVITTVAGNGTQGYSGDNGPATAAELDYPEGVAVDSAGDLFIVDFFNNRIREVNYATGLITTVAGNGTVGYSGDNGPVTAAYLWNPSGVAVDSAGDLFIADTDNNRVREVANGVPVTVLESSLPTVTGVSPTSGPTAGGTTVTITGTGFTDATQVDFGAVAASSFTVNSAGTQITATSPAESAGTVHVTVTTAGGTSAKSSADQFTYLAETVDLTWSGPGNALNLVETTPGGTPTITISEPSSNLLEIDLGAGEAFASGSTTAVTGLTYQNPGSPTTSQYATIDISETNNVTSLAATLPGDDLTLGQINDSNAGIGSIVASAATIAVAGIDTVNANGNVDLAATGNLMVDAGAIVETGTGTITLAADVNADGTGNDGVGTLSINSGATVTSTNPTASAITLRGANIDIATGANPAVVGASRQLTTTPSATLSLLDGPIALAFDHNGNLYVANYLNRTVSEFAPGSTTPTATLTGLNEPDAMAGDSSGNLYVANNGNGTVSEFAPGSTTPTKTLTGLNEPSAPAFDSSGNLYVAGPAQSA